MLQNLIRGQTFESGSPLVERILNNEPVSLPPGFRLPGRSIIPEVGPGFGAPPPPDLPFTDSVGRLAWIGFNLMLQMQPELKLLDWLMLLNRLRTENAAPMAIADGRNGWVTTSTFCGGGNGAPGTGTTFTITPGGDNIWCANHANLGAPFDGWGGQALGSNNHYTEWKRYPVDFFGGWASPIADWSASSAPATNTGNPFRPLAGPPRPNTGWDDLPNEWVKLDPRELVSVMPALGPLVQTTPKPVSARRLAAFRGLQGNPFVMRESSREARPQRERDHVLRWLFWLDQLAALEKMRQLGHAAQPRVWVGRVPLPDPWVDRLPRYSVGPWSPPQPFPRLIIQPPGLPPITFEPMRFGPQRGRNRERKLTGRGWHGLIHALMLATYTGGLVRALFQSVPKQCRSKSRSGKRRYDSMLADIQRCWGQIDWDKFRILLAEMLAKYAVEGRIIGIINRGPASGSGFGAATNIYHATVGSDFGSSDPRVSPISGGRQDPFSILSAGIREFNNAVFPYLLKGG